MAKNVQIALTPDQLRVLGLAEGGADVWGYTEAMAVREIRRLHPQLIRIVKPRGAPKDGAQQQPYFGVIAKKAGRDLLAQFRASPPPAAEARK
jgi:hypothetical protein